MLAAINVLYIEHTSLCLCPCAGCLCRYILCCHLWMVLYYRVFANCGCVADVVLVVVAVIVVNFVKDYALMVLKVACVGGCFGEVIVLVYLQNSILVQNYRIQMFLYCYVQSIMRWFSRVIEWNAYCVYIQINIIYNICLVHTECKHNRLQRKKN